MHTTRSLSFVLLCCLWVLGRPALAQSRIVVHKCTDAAGQTSFQQQPCPQRSSAERLEVDGDIDPALAQAARERAAANAPTPKPAATLATQDNPDPAQTRPEPRRPPPCPPTRENPGRIAVGNDPMSLAIARLQYNELPSETALKNSGRWPRGCVRSN